MIPALTILIEIDNEWTGSDFDFLKAKTIKAVVGLDVSIIQVFIFQQSFTDEPCNTLIGHKLIIILKSL